MGFNSIAFLLFLPIVFLLYWLLFGKRLKWQNGFVVVSSYIFYGWWDIKFLLLISATTFFSYLSGLAIEQWNPPTNSSSVNNNETDFRAPRKPWKARTALWANIILNVGILCLFKYYNFFVHNLQALLAPMGLNPDSITLNLILPVGISFYTFQALSYSIDVYRHKIKATRDIIAFFAFISFFPQLVAGPIERATNLLPQFLKSRRFSYPEAVDGCRQILWGFFKKVVLADNCAVFANQAFADPDSMGGLNLWIGALCFSFQIYGDFSGYSDIAIGVSKLFGINLMRNFNNPYFSRDIAEFWRRWHISLTTWFRDYIYIPLGGSRVTKHKTLRNTFIIFLVSGLWHGAEWTFVAWGAYHAVLFTPLIAMGKNRKYLDNPGQGRSLPTMRESLYMGITFLLVCAGWVIFRADNIGHAWNYLIRMLTNFHYGGGRPELSVFLWMAITIAVEWIQRDRPHPFAITGNGILRYASVRWILYLTIVMLCYCCKTVQSNFIYFQF
ncbi:MAG: MBOAT family protein [Muribaculaceae bacterium]|nr:MBOAT family protein [Muribaculaceae bacterium]